MLVLLGMKLYVFAINKNGETHYNLTNVQALIDTRD